MAYTTIDDPTAYFQTALYTGNASSNKAITNDGNSDLQPDWVWIKERSSTSSHFVNDSVRGAGKNLYTNLAEAEGTNTALFTSFDSDGFTVGNTNQGNQNNETYVAWQWKSESAVSGNTLQGGSNSKTYAGSVNTTAGISIIKYVGNGVGGHEIPHNLSETPVFYIIKRLSDTEHWQVYHAHNTSAPQTDYLQLSTNEATVDANTRWNDTAPGTNSIVVGSHASVNTEDDNYVAYIFSQKKGYSKFGIYTGNGQASDGPFIYLGFKPAFLIIKTNSHADDWRLLDNRRSGSGGFNPNNVHLYAHTNGADATSSTNSVPDGVDFLSNGFKIRQATNGLNRSAGTYIYMAWAENPFVTSTGITTTAE